MNRSTERDVGCVVGWGGRGMGNGESLYPGTTEAAFPRGRGQESQLRQGQGEGPQTSPQDPHPRRSGCSASPSGLPGSVPHRYNGLRPPPPLCSPGHEQE